MKIKNIVEKERIAKIRWKNLIQAIHYTNLQRRINPSLLVNEYS